MRQRHLMLMRIVCILVALASGAVAATAQQGHPLEGTWQGYWGKTPAERNFLTLILHWEGQAIVGQVNPGPDAGSIRNVQLDSSTWTVRLDLDVKDRRSGETVRVLAEGRLLNIGSPNRVLTGSLLGENPDGYFRISRQ